MRNISTPTLAALAAAALLAAPAFASSDPVGITVAPKDKEISASKAGASSLSAPVQGSALAGPLGAARNSFEPLAAQHSVDDGEGRLFNTADETVESTNTSDFTVIEIGLLETLKSLWGSNSGGQRGVVKIAGGKKWAIKFRYSDTRPRANFPWTLGGTNGFPTAGGKYTFKAAISKTVGVVEGDGAVCPGQITMNQYATCSGACNMKWEVMFNDSGPRHPASGFCHLETGETYYLNIAPTGPGCVDGPLVTNPPSPAVSHGCPLVLETGNGAQAYLNPSGETAACRHWFGPSARYDPQHFCAID